MRLGIDLGTTRTLIAVEDRGNYPLVGFTDSNGDLLDHYPTISAEVEGALVHGPDADAAARGGAPALYSWKRLLSRLGAGDAVRVGRLEMSMLDLVTSYLEALRRDLFVRSNLPPGLADPLEAVVSVPANAHSTQRFVTLEAFRRAGFDVRAVLNEPSAAGIEYAHRHRTTITSRREHVVVYDLGGGTFDAALVLLSDGRHDVVTTSGVARLGGDDFDAVLLDLALERAGLGSAADLAPSELALLTFECRTAKEALNPNSRRVVLELEALGSRAPAQPVVVDVAAYYERVRPLVQRTLDALEPVLARAPALALDAPPDSASLDGAGAPDSAAAPESRRPSSRPPSRRTGARSDAPREVADGDLAGIYVVGGASGLPIVPRTLRERFGRRVFRSPHPAGATAMGLAIVAASEAPPPVTEVLTRHLGVFRERDGGAYVSFDEILPKGTALAGQGASIAAVRRYRAAHNVGHFRFVECGSLDPAGDPTGDITPHADVLFPFATDLVGNDLAAVPIERLGEGPLVEERYEVDAAGIVAVTITNLDAGYAQSYVL